MKLNTEDLYCGRQAFQSGFVGIWGFISVNVKCEGHNID